MARMRERANRAGAGVRRASGGPDAPGAGAFRRAGPHALPHPAQPATGTERAPRGWHQRGGTVSVPLCPPERDAQPG